MCSGVYNSFTSVQWLFSMLNRCCIAMCHWRRRLVEANDWCNLARVFTTMRFFERASNEYEN
jgi:hypothetical protein